MEKITKMKFSKVYPLLRKKAERKGRTKEEVDEIIFWLTGYLPEQWSSEATYQEFFEQAPCFSEKASQITGKVCGIRVEDIADPLIQKIRYLDKLIDELAQGKTMNAILRKEKKEL